MWQIELSEEVAEWYDALKGEDRVKAQWMFDLLAQHGPVLRMPHAKYLGDKLWELRFYCEQVNRRVSYVFDTEQKIITLTTFRKQRQNESREIARARRALARYRGREKK
ncbi:type II toxin-antitoxin system RelE/ParE family toxin [Nocardia brasiliensis]|uniref:type II toxin-antitoxin system RelE/ParE family toxin n=1 Tax=Nocardia brasiliensis TaxID=37326 RepID=UPI001894044D|nr:type II toxin-antitoxin system RelE/ParE family toxin [Nocardia brasiliensis]MBF6127717.1 type II toxin-antitoxin system RelE/ParE family toxin [Nocardia brasiliensis]